MTDTVVEDLAAWRNRPLDRVYAVVFVDAIVVKIRERQVGNRPVYVAVGINLASERDVLGMWVGTGGEGAKQWLVYLTELRNRGVQDVLIICSDGLKGLGEAIEAAWPLATHQTCVVHLVRNSLRYSNRRDWQPITPAPRGRVHRPDDRRGAATLRRVHRRMGGQVPGGDSVAEAGYGPAGLATGRVVRRWQRPG